MAHNNGEWVATPSEPPSDYLSFGPYVKLSPGQYKLSFLYRCLSKKKTDENAISFELATFDPTTKRPAIKKSVEVKTATCNNDLSVSSWIFDASEVDSAKYTYEFRVFSYRTAEVRLKEIRVERLSK